MKKTLTINLDVEVVEKLRGLENYSSLINDLLENHFGRNNMTEEEIIADVKRKIEAKKQLEEKREESKKQEEKREEEMMNMLISCVEQDMELAKEVITCEEGVPMQELRKKYLAKNIKMDYYSLLKYKRLKNGS